MMHVNATSLYNRKYAKENLLIYNGFGVALFRRKGQYFISERVQSASRGY